MKKLFTLLTMMGLIALSAQAQSEAIYSNPNAIPGELESIVITMTGGGATCNPQLAYNEYAEITPEQNLALIGSGSPSWFRFHEGQTVDVEVVITHAGGMIQSNNTFPPVDITPDFPNYYWNADIVWGDQNLEAEITTTGGWQYTCGLGFNAECVDPMVNTFSFQLTQNWPTINNVNSDELRINLFDGGFFEGPLDLEIVSRIVVTGSEIQGNPLWTTIAPSVPQLILRDPPGDESYAYLENQSTTCHGYGMSSSTNSSNSAWASARIGVSGEVGLLYSTEVEAYAEFSGGVEMGVESTSDSEYEMCFTTTSAYQTTEDNGLTGTSGDVYMGASIEYAYGIFRTLVMDNPCTVDVYVHSELVLEPIGTQSTFVYTESHILGNVIPDLEEAIADPSTSAAAVEVAQDQLEVWQQALAMNETIKANADFETTKNFSGNTNNPESTSITTSQVHSIEMNTYIDWFVQAEVGVYAAGSGVSGGAKIRTRTENGSSEFASNSNTNTIMYSLGDDDATDSYSVDVYRDRVFGTPIFYLDEDLSETSCPYAGGYQIDQPHLQVIDGTQEITLDNIPVGEEGVFFIDICNDSDFDRTYHLKFDLASNPSGAILNAGGENIIATSEGHEYTLIPAGTCLENIAVNVSQETLSILDYEGIVLYLYAACQPASAPILSQVIVNAHFTEGNPDNVDELTQAAFNVFPNPNDGNFQVSFDRLQSTSQLVMFDATGREVYSTQLAAGSGVKSINGLDLPDGVYLMTISNGHQASSEKVLVH